MHDPDDDSEREDSQPERNPPEESADEAQQPTDWRAFAGLPLDRLEADLKSLRGVRDRTTREAWLATIAAIPRIRALREHYGGDEFKERGEDLFGIKPTQAYEICQFKTVHAEEQSARARGIGYLYPELGRMIGWYRPKTKGKSRGQEDEAEDEDEADGGNDLRTKKQLRADELLARDQAQKLTGRLSRAEQRLNEVETELARKQRQVTEQMETISTLGEMVTARDAQIAAWRSQLATTPSPEPPPEPVNNNEPPVRDPIAPDPERTDAPTLGEIKRDLDVEAVEKQWSLRDFRGGQKAPTARRALARQNRAAGFLMLAPGDTQGAAQLGRLTMGAWWRVEEHMTLVDVLALVPAE